MKILDLVLKGKWYGMEVSGVKTEEYRQAKPYWCKRLLEGAETLEWWQEKFLWNVLWNKPNASEWVHNLINVYGLRDYTHVRIRRGYTSTTSLFPIKEITIGFGNPDWGAPTDQEVFIIKLGERVKE